METYKNNDSLKFKFKNFKLTKIFKKKNINEHMQEVNENKPLTARSSSDCSKLIILKFLLRAKMIM